MGSEPDPRTSLANERTALAGLRTSLGMVVAGVGLAALAELVEDPGWFRAAAPVICLLGGLLTVLTVRRWARVERALRLGEELPSPSTLPPLAVTLVVLALGLAALIWLGGLS